MAEHSLRKRAVGLVSRIELAAHPLRRRSGEGVETGIYILVLFSWSVLVNGHDSESSMSAVFNVVVVVGPSLFSLGSGSTHVKHPG